MFTKLLLVMVFIITNRKSEHKSAPGTWGTAVMVLIMLGFTLFLSFGGWGSEVGGGRSIWNFGLEMLTDLKAVLERMLREMQAVETWPVKFQRKQGPFLRFR